ncbi:unnamed protein product [Eruca vesicaria subsp. sativa]|uniref:Uncharacterized protein n=1 Tax=Eruca vesicaria subsp. sativa TaxID=29727 RepID=A0ABC8JLL1_ERUVS|nr:unnamed protein product [Eruca vesicaria subsp. sativa]
MWRRNQWLVLKWVDGYRRRSDDGDGAGFGGGCALLTNQTDSYKLDDVIDLVIPRGSNQLVSQIKNAPVLGHADGICHVYVDKACNVDMAKRIVSDEKLDYPAACNAMKTLLVHKDLEQNAVFNELIFALQSNGTTIDIKAVTTQAQARNSRI